MTGELFESDLPWDVLENSRGAPIDTGLSGTSIVIVTYARDSDLADLLSCLKNSDQIGDTEIVLVDNNQDSIDRSAILEGFSHAVYYKACRNLGCTGGRNAGIKRARGEILVFIDDDGLPGRANFIEVVNRKFRTFPRLGILGFKITDPSTGGVREFEFPHTDKSKIGEAEFKTFRFIGAGFAARRIVFDKAGLFSGLLSYGADEFEFAYRAIKAGYEIVYTSEIHVAHKRSASGRANSVSAWERLLRNKLLIGYLHLPFWYFLGSSVVWVGATLIKSHGRANVAKVGAEFLRWVWKNRRCRDPLDHNARIYVAECGGQLWK